MEERSIAHEAAVNEQKRMKKDIGRMGWGLILYTVVNFSVVMFDTIRQIVLMRIENGGAELQEQQITALSESAVSMIIAVSVGTLVLWLFMGKRVDTKEMFVSKKEMNAKTLFQLVSVFMTVQIIFSGVVGFMEAGLNMLGYTAMASIESATGASDTISMFLYASFIGPIVEELVYRGFVQGFLSKYGKMFGMIVAALLFGIMHANVAQIPFAFFVGIVLGYVAAEYSLKWAIIVHIINNFVFVELMGIIGKIFGETAEIFLSNGVVYGLSVVGIVVLWKNRENITSYIKENKGPNNRYIAVVTTVPILLFTVVNLLLAVLAIQPLG